MFKKFLVFLSLIILCVISFALIFKDYLLKTYIINYLAKNFNGECKIEKLHLSLSSIQIENLLLRNKDVDIKFKREYIEFNFSKLSKVIISNIIFQDASLEIKNLENIKNTFADIKPNKPPAVVQIFPLNLDLKNIKIKVEKTKGVDFNINFSFTGSLSADTISLNDIAISDFSLFSDNFSLTHLNVKKHKGNLHALTVPNLKIGSKEFKDLLIPLKIEANKIIFPKAKNYFFGSEAYLGGILRFNNFKNICIDTVFENSSFENIIKIAGGEDSANMGGLFDGKFSLCWQGNKISSLEGKFRNERGGFINIKREAAFDFLRQYLDEPSYKALIDNLKNYEYNIGMIKIGKKDDVLSLSMDFNSDVKGRRTVTINFHNITGGVK